MEQPELQPELLPELLPELEPELLSELLSELQQDSSGVRAVSEWCSSGGRAVFERCLGDVRAVTERRTELHDEQCEQRGPCAHPEGRAPIELRQACADPGSEHEAELQERAHLAGAKARGLRAEEQGRGAEGGGVGSLGHTAELESFGRGAAPLRIHAARLLLPGWSCGQPRASAWAVVLWSGGWPHELQVSPRGR